MSRGNTTISSVNQHRERMPFLKLPAYQRGIVWTPEQVLSLIDSAERGFPLGQILIWEVYKDGKREQYCIDGQQRLAALTGRRAGESKNTWTVWFDLDKCTWSLEEPERGMLLWPENTMAVLNRIDALGGMDAPGVSEAIKRIDNVQYNSTLPVYILTDATPEDVLEMFKRYNTGGTPIGPKMLEWLTKQEISR